MNEWIRQFIDYPQGAFVQFTREFLRKNKLYKGQMSFGGKVADPRTIRAALLGFAGRSDSVVPVAAAEAAMEVVGGADKTFKIVPGGHMGVFAGGSAPQHVWQPTAEWLAARSEPLRGAAPRRGRSAADAA